MALAWGGGPGIGIDTDAERAPIRDRPARTEARMSLGFGCGFHRGQEEPNSRVGDAQGEKIGPRLWGLRRSHYRDFALQVRRHYVRVELHPRDQDLGLPLVKREPSHRDLARARVTPVGRMG